ncbi:hypothetical protein AB3N61_13950 [Leptospira sp. WS58.C1]|uniref:hypothetical protein n=1 Tax=Leptospira cinconiae TaxID=3235173 RepID=UPI00349E5560
MKQRILILIFILLSYYGCISIPWESSGTFIAAEGFKDYKNLKEERVEGKSCTYYGPFFPIFVFGKGTLQDAFKEALLLSPKGTQGLSDVEMYHTDYSVLLFSWKCVTVNGYPAQKK